MTRSFEQWKEEVLDLANGRCGLSRMEAETFNWRPFFADGLSPEEAVSAYEENILG